MFKVWLPGGAQPTVPLSPRELDWLLESAERNFANPKSATWPTISSLSRILLGLRSQWMIDVSQ